MKNSNVHHLPAEVLVDPRVFSESTKPEWAIGPLTHHRFAVLVTLITFAGLFYLLQIWLWPAQRVATTPLEKAWVLGHYLWMAGAPMCAVMLFGNLFYRKQPLVNIVPIANRVVWRIVTRGDNVEALLHTIHETQSVMKQFPLFPYLIEVLTESGVLEETIVPQVSGDVIFLHVPKEYQTPNKTRFKARALHYAVEHSVIKNDDWIVHLDEETCPTESGVLGIAKLIGEEETSGELRVGQGAILYHRQWKQYPFLTLADNSRTGMDFGPFYLQSRLGTSFFGFHGSYIVIRNDVEKATGGFDLGQSGDITEDAWWILIANTQGIKIRWTEGFLAEQSTQSLKDFIKQRRRWLEGLIKVVRFAPVPIWRRMPLAIGTILWGMVCLSVLYSVANLFYGFDINPWMRLVANMTWAAGATMYIVGLRANMDAAGITHPLTRLKWMVIQGVLMPVFCLIEIVSGVAGFFFPQNGFHVIKK